MRDRILYGVQGEGRGHASRSLMMIRALQKRGYDLEVFTGGDALAMLKGAGCRIHYIPLLRYCYHSNGSLSFFDTFLKNFGAVCGLLFGMGKRFKVVSKKVSRSAPAMIISDFEPYLARIANKNKIPLVSLNHQQFLVECKIPVFKEWRKTIMLSGFRFFTGFLTGRPDKIIVSSFYHFPPKTGSKATFVGPFLDESLQKLKLGCKGHITVYLKNSTHIHSLLRAMSVTSGSVRWEVFANWDKINPPVNAGHHIKFFSINRQKFLKSLAGSRALLTTAGNQVLGEAIYLGKPVLAFPEPGVLEQELNGLALQQSGFGWMRNLECIDVKLINDFLNQMPLMNRDNRWSALIENYDATHESLCQIERFIQTRHLQLLPSETLKYSERPSRNKSHKKISPQIKSKIPMAA